MGCTAFPRPARKAGACQKEMRTGWAAVCWLHPDGAGGRSALPVTVQEQPASPGSWPGLPTFHFPITLGLPVLSHLHEIMSSLSAS